jgi:hypothetical protein
MDKDRRRLRIRWPNGAEFEAEGSSEFIQVERAQFLADLAGIPGAASPEESLQEPPHISWEAVTELKGRHLQLRAKLPGKSEQESCLILLAASQKLLNEAKPTASQLAKWLRGSGYPVLRMDRALQEAVAGGLILSSGSRRARRYELTAPGRMKAYILANELTALITGRR